MKGIVLAGGTGSRLFPLTKITNKYLLPVYDKPKIYCLLQALVDTGIADILIVTGGRNTGDFPRLVANGQEFGLTHLDDTSLEGEGEITEGLGLPIALGLETESAPSSATISLRGRFKLLWKRSACNRPKQKFC